MQCVYPGKDRWCLHTNTGKTRVSAPDETDVEALRAVDIPQGLNVEIIDFGD